MLWQALSLMNKDHLADSHLPLSLSRWKLALFLGWALGCSLGLQRIAPAQAPAPAKPLHVLIVGGGPNLEHNQVAIESNVRYVNGLLPPAVKRTTLFADGKAQSATVLYDVDTSANSPAQQLLSLLLADQPGGEADPHYRRPNLGAPLDGAAQLPAIDKAFDILALLPPGAASPILLSFTGHGSPDKGDHENNRFDLWAETGPDAGLAVHKLAEEIDRLPAGAPVTLVMVQCFSGAFGNLLFEGGNPQGALIRRDIAGFFATTKDRVAAGCTPEVNEADYHDFTSYFFAALTGRSRMGQSVTGADYNRDGRVGMDEAYCYTLAHDKSIDVPVCTSDVFLRRFVPMPDAQLFQTPYNDVTAWATPAQNAALEALTQTLHLAGAQRVAAAYLKLKNAAGPPINPPPSNSSPERQAQLMKSFTTLQQSEHRKLLRRYPALGSPQAPAYAAARQSALAQLTLEMKRGQWQEFFISAMTLSQAQQVQESQDIAESNLLRFVRLCKSVILAHELREHGEATMQARYARLVAAEGQSPLPPATITLPLVASP